MRSKQVQRLKTRQQFQAVLAGQTVARTAHFALHMAGLDMPVTDVTATQTAPSPLFDHTDVWIGAMVPKRWAKRAVTRNSIKRQIYSVSGHYELAMPKAAHIVRLRAGFDRAQYPSATSEQLKKVVRAEIEQLFKVFTISQGRTVT